MGLIKYNIENWQVQFPSEWDFSVDEESNPPQFVFDSDEVTVYVSIWNLRNSRGEFPDKNTVFSLFEQGFLQRGQQITDEFSAFYPENFLICASKGVTNDGYEMISFAVCDEGTAASVYFVFETGADKQKYLCFLRYVDFADLGGEDVTQQAH